MALTLLNIYELHKMKTDYASHVQPSVEAKEGKYGTKQHIVWVEGKHVSIYFIFMFLCKAKAVNFLLSNFIFIYRLK